MAGNSKSPQTSWYVSIYQQTIMHYIVQIISVVQFWQVAFPDIFNHEKFVQWYDLALEIK